MMKIIVRNIILLFLLSSCNEGIWHSNQVYRPKHPKFKIAGNAFNGNAQIDNNFIYLSTKRFFNYDGRVLVGYIGFYKDGKMIIDNSWEDEISTTLNERNSISTSSAIGHYTTEADEIKLEYFLQGGGGQYITKAGIIKQDTIILKETVYLLFKKEIRYDTLVRSNYQLE